MSNPQRRERWRERGRGNGRGRESDRERTEREREGREREGDGDSFALHVMVLLAWYLGFVLVCANAMWMRLELEQLFWLWFARKSAKLFNGRDFPPSCIRGPFSNQDDAHTVGEKLILAERVVAWHVLAMDQQRGSG